MLGKTKKIGLRIPHVRRWYTLLYQCGLLDEKLRCLVARFHANQYRLSQRPPLGVRPSSGHWFAKVPRVVVVLSNMIPLLSMRAKLSTRCTRHCVRASVIRDVKSAGFSCFQLPVTNVGRTFKRTTRWAPIAINTTWETSLKVIHRHQRSPAPNLIPEPTTHKAKNS